MSDTVIDVQRHPFGQTVRSEWIKLASLRSTWWTTAAMIVLGVGFTTIICGVVAGDLADGSSTDAPSEYVTQGLVFSQISAVVIGALMVTSEYGTGLIRATLAATPLRDRVLAAKAVVLSGFLFVIGLVTAFGGYVSGSAFLHHAGVPISLGDDGQLRSLIGGSAYLAGLGLLAASVGLVLRHTAAVISIVLALVFIIGQVVQLIPGATGEWIMKLMPGNAGPVIAVPDGFGDPFLAPWVGFGVFAAEVAMVGLVGLALFRRRDA